MMRSLFAGVSGLRNHQVRMDVIGNNIANVNTVGFKASRVTFQDVLSQTLSNATSPNPGGGRGGVNPQQVGLGMTIGAIDTNHTQGSIQMTGKTTDLALEGDGFFVLSDGNKKYYSRAGTFGMDKLGNIVNGPNGLAVSGWMADEAGTINLKTPVQPIRLNLGATIKPKATTSLVLGGNLDASDTNVLELSSKSFQVTSGAGNSYTIHSEIVKENNEYKLNLTSDDGTLTETSFPITVSGSDVWNLTLSGPTSTFAFTSADGSESVSFDVAPALNNGILQVSSADVALGWAAPDTPVPSFEPAVVQTSEVFDSAGQAHVVTTTFSRIGYQKWEYTTTAPDGSSASGVVSFNTDGSYSEAGTVINSLTFSPVGADPVTINPDFSEMTRYADENSVFMVSQDGYEEGVMESFTIDSQGVLTGEFTNGLTKALGQVAVAKFNNPAGLLKAGENMFAVSNNSGEANVGEANVGGRGGITPGALEMSNVDLSQEFTDMIVTQRGFQANSRIITTSDEMLQELVNLKR